MATEILDGEMVIGNTTPQSVIVLGNLNVVVMEIITRNDGRELSEEEFLGEFRKLGEAWELQNPKS